MISHSRYVIFQMAEVSVPKTLFLEILVRILRLRFLTIPSKPDLCVELMKTGFWNGGQGLSAKIAVENRFLTQLLGLFGVFVRHGKLNVPEYSRN